MKATLLGAGGLLLLAVTALPSYAWDQCCVGNYGCARFYLPVPGPYRYYSPVFCRPLDQAPGTFGRDYYQVRPDGVVTWPHYHVYPPFPPFQAIQPGTAIPPQYMIDKRKKAEEAKVAPVPPQGPHGPTPPDPNYPGHPAHGGLRNLMAEGYTPPHMMVQPRMGVGGTFAAGNELQQTNIRYVPGPPALQFGVPPQGGLMMPQMPMMPQFSGQMPMTPAFPGAMPQTPTFPGAMPQMPMPPQFRPGMPMMPQAPMMPQLPRMDQMQQMPGQRPDLIRTPAFPMMPGMPVQPMMPMPPNAFATMPVQPGMPMMPGMPVQPWMPAMPMMPAMPAAASMPAQPPPPQRPPMTSFPTHPYARSPRDFFMWGDMQDDPLFRDRRGTYVP